MSSKHPGRQTEYSKFRSIMKKLQNKLDADKADRVRHAQKTKE